MKKLIFTSIVLLMLVVGVASAQNTTDLDLGEIQDIDSEISEIEINIDGDVDEDLLSFELIADSSGDDELPSIGILLANESSATLEDSSQDGESHILGSPGSAGDFLRANETSNAIYISPTGTGLGLTSDDPASWSYAIANIQDEGIIYFMDGEYFINEFVKNRRDLIFQAVNTGSAIINADNRNYALRTLGDRTKIIGLTFINAANYAAVYSTDSLTVINSTFKNNLVANTNGGALYSFKNIDVINSTFINNSAGRMGGAVYAGYDVNVVNSTFQNNSASSGGALYSRQNIIVKSSKFKNNNASDQAGAINAFNNIEVNDCEFIDNIATASGGAIMADFVNCSNSLFANNTSINGGGAAIYSRGEANISTSRFMDNSGKTTGAVSTSTGINYISDCYFKNNTAGGTAGAVNGNTNYINNTHFIANTAANNGGAVYSYVDSIINGCEFSSNRANRGGAVYSNQGLSIVNSNFNNNSGEEYGGALYGNTLITVDNTRFEDNTVNDQGGAIFGKNIKVNNSEFIKNTAVSYGGAIGAWGGDVEVNNSKFLQNHADEIGGAIISSDAGISNCEFMQNSADGYGGAVYVVNCDVNDSNFTENNAVKSGGAIYSDYSNIASTSFVKNNSTNGGALISEKADIRGSEFIANTGFDGAAIDCDTLSIENSLFNGNEAKSFGVVYTVNATIKDSEFKDNKALDNKQIFALNTLDLTNTAISANEFELANTTQDYIKNITEDYIIELESGLIGYCTQRTIYWTNGDVYVMDELDLLRNQKTGEYIGEYLKILLYRFYENRSDLIYAVWSFTDGDFKNSNDTYVKEVVRLYDSGFRVPDKGAALILPNQTQIVFDFYSAGKSSTQNLFLYNVTCYGNNYSLEIVKLSLNRTVKLGQATYFDVLVSNTGDTILHNIRVVEEAHDDLRYLSSTNITGSWNHFIENNRHVFVLGELYPNASAMFRIVFNTTSTGVKRNVVVVSSNETNNTNASNNTTVYKPGLSVEKITLTPVVKVGEITRFEIIVCNTGDIILNNVSVVEYDFEGLIYNGFKNKKGVWEHRIINNKHVFILKSPLGVNESASFIISFLTTKTGDFNNTVIAISNETDPVAGQNTTKVINITSYKTPENKTNNDKKRKHDSSKNQMLETGNTFTILVLSIILVSAMQIRRRK